METFNTDDLVEIAEDLVASIKNAAWTNSKGKPNLHAPTPHMVRAIEKLNDTLHPKCYACGRTK